MEQYSHETLAEYLTKGRMGDALLFVGSGFSASSLNFSDKALGTGGPLLAEFNSALGYEYSDLQVAADDYKDEFGAVGPQLGRSHPPLYTFLNERYRVCHVSSDAVDILNYPWWRIYTTNYDNLVDRALSDLSRPFYPVNNLQSPEDAVSNSGAKPWVVHIHGRLEQWDPKNFEESCVLGRESYLKVTRNGPWPSQLRDDVSYASVVVFVGFSNSDLHLAQALLSASANRQKVFFVNSERSVADRELIAKQKPFGTPLAIGMRTFAEMVFAENAAPRDSDALPNLHNFRHRAAIEPAADRAGVQEQESFIVWGKESPKHLQRDINDDSESYRAKRTVCYEILDFVQGNSKAVAMVIGGICSGKTLILEEIAVRLVDAGELVFSLDGRFQDVVEEAKMILEKKSGCVLVIDDIYQLKDGAIADILDAVNRFDGRIIMSARTIAFDRADDATGEVPKGVPYRVFDTEKLTKDELSSVQVCVERLGLQQIGKIRGAPRLADILLDVFNSQSVQDRYEAELNKVKARSNGELDGLILAFYLAHTGLGILEDVLTTMLDADSVDLLTGGSGSNQFISYSHVTKKFDVLPSVNARAFLKKVIKDPERVASVVIRGLDNIDNFVRRREPYKSVSQELMRFSNLQAVIPTEDVRDKFFDRLSERPYCRNHVHFWLQWCMAMREAKNYGRAETYIEKAYEKAAELDRKYGNYDTRYLDDQKAGLLLDKVQPNDSPGPKLRAFNAAMVHIVRNVRHSKQTWHVYQTIDSSLRRFLSEILGDMDPMQQTSIKNQLSQLQNFVLQRAEVEERPFLQQRMAKVATYIGEVAHS